MSSWSSPSVAGRIPSAEYTRPKKRGQGEITVPPQAALTEPDGTVLARLEQVNARVREIIGLDRDQFAQTVMIAQGDFQKLLPKKRRKQA